MVVRAKNLSGVSYKGTNAFMRAPTSWANFSHHPKAPPPNIITLGTSTYDLRMGGINIQSIERLESKLEDSVIFSIFVLPFFSATMLSFTSSLCERPLPLKLGPRITFCRAFSLPKAQSMISTSPHPSLFNLLLFFSCIHLFMSPIQLWILQREGACFI